MARTEHTYNATAIGYEGDKPVCMGLVQFTQGRIFRSNGLWTHNNGLPEYHEDYLRHIPSFVTRTDIVLDNGACFKHALCGGFSNAAGNAPRPVATIAR